MNVRCPSPHALSAAGWAGLSGYGIPGRSPARACACVLCEGKLPGSRCSSNCRVGEEQVSNLEDLYLALLKICILDDLAPCPESGQALLKRSHTDEHIRPQRAGHFAQDSDLRLGFGVWVLGFGVWGLGFWILSLGFLVSGFGFRVSDFGSRVLGFGFWVSDFGGRA